MAAKKCYTRCIQAFPDGCGFAIGSIEGRVAVEYFDVDGPAKKFAFRCHRRDGLIFPVNAISFHPTYGTFATGGSDRVVSIWDAKNKKKLSQFTGMPNGVSSLSFNADGTVLAIAASYTYDNGAPDGPTKEHLILQEIIEEHVKPKPKK